MDIKAKIDEIVKKIKGDPNLMKEFQSDPAAAVKKVSGIDLPADQLGKIVEGVKAKINLDGIAGKLGGLFGKKK